MTDRPISTAGIRHGDPEHAAALGFLYDRINYETIGGSGSRYPFRLQRMRGLLCRLGLQHLVYAPGSPAGSVAIADRRVPLVHIAGTKGKGSTSTMVATMLSAAGYRTGLYTSPHLHRLEERFRVDGQECGPAELVALVARLRDAIRGETNLGHPNRDSGHDTATSCTLAEDNYSFFELTTALALLHFDAFRCDCIVLEVGLGGRLDSTNVCAPSVTAITSIGLDHQHVLGHTLSQIAAEKAGIIKTGVPVVCGVVADEPRDVIHAIAAEKGAQIWQRGRDYDFDAKPQCEWGSRLQYIGRTSPLRSHLEATLSLEGTHQAGNAAIAISIIDLLRHQGMSIPMESASLVLSHLQCAGRIERYRLPGQVIGIVDSAHNQDSVGALCDAIRSRREGRSVTVVFGTSRDKSADVMLGQLASVADRFVFTRFLGNPRYQTTSELVRLAPHSHAQLSTTIEDPLEACKHALRATPAGGILVVCGSFFLAAETRGWFASLADPIEPTSNQTESSPSP